MPHPPLFLALLSLSLVVGCKKQVEVSELPFTENVTPAAAVPITAQPVVVALQEQNFERVHFGYDSAVLDAASKAALLVNADIMKEYPSIGLVVQGHCDERGPTEYNLALGARRAQVVYDHLQALGVAPSQMKTISMGEEAPLETERNEHAWSENRRAEFLLVSGAPDTVLGTTSKP